MDGFGAALAEWIAWRMFVAAGIIGVICVAVGLTVGWLMFSAAPKPQTWDEWLADLLGALLLAAGLWLYIITNWQGP